MTATTTADRRRIIELKLWMEDHDITVKATSEYLGWAFGNHTVQPHGCLGTQSPGKAAGPWLSLRTAAATLPAAGKAAVSGGTAPEFRRTRNGPPSCI